jgi:hypothetical protein
MDDGPNAAHPRAPSPAEDNWLFLNMATTTRELLDVKDPESGQSVLSPTEAQDILEWRDTNGITFQDGKIEQLANLCPRRLAYIRPFIDCSHVWRTQAECDTALQMRLIRRAYNVSSRFNPLKWRENWRIPDDEEFNALVMIPHPDDHTYTILPTNGVSPHVKAAGHSLGKMEKLYMFSAPERINVDELYTLLHFTLQRCKVWQVQGQSAFLESLVALVVHVNRKFIINTIENCIKVMLDVKEQQDVQPRYVLTEEEEEQELDVDLDDLVDTEERLSPVLENTHRSDSAQPEEEEEDEEEEEEYDVDDLE